MRPTSAAERVDSSRTLLDLGQITECARIRVTMWPGTAMCHRETSPIFGFHEEEKARSLPGNWEIRRLSF